jgi:hypothetical protein
MSWKVELLDVFEHSWHVVGRYPTREEAVAVARAKFAKLQPPPGQPDITGGPHPPGIQDRIFVIPPEGEGEGWQYLGD